ncbi:ABC transporter permease [Egicoccus halophilus]|uniref:Transport permease protein n=1 Tax=Egicoccus halophilus TaxID=1670830 RepID=A0A8J3ADL6_9ACTN|nr:ABC transporter permease [Egicoccus halophilus]GGI04807.1 transport permease protein [Egicoccus halophilus]
MNPVIHAVRSGVRRGLLEFRYLLTDRSELSSTVFYGLIPLGFLLWFSVSGEALDIGSETFPVARFVAPGIYAMVISFSVLGPMYVLATEREDGTLLRSRTVPHGLVSYVVGKIVAVLCETLFGLALVLGPALLFIDGLADVAVSGWLRFLLVLALGSIAILPLGVLVGALLRTPKGIFSFGLVGIGVLTWFSGLIQPLQTFPTWVQQVAQVLPFHWLGHGMRHALLPDTLRTVELGGVWRPTTALLVLGAWAIVGLVCAPWVLRRTARRESGSRVEARRQAALQRTA